MRENSVSEEPVHTNATKIEPVKNNNTGKWLIGAAAAALLVGGGYLAWQSTNDAPRDDMQTAYSEDYSAEPASSSAELEANEQALAEIAAEDEEAPAPRTTAPIRTARADAIPEATIGVAPASATSEDGDAIVVPAPRRPVWERTPSARRLSALYPERALDRGREGQAQLTCIVEQRGTLDCDRVSETPGGFGPAAIRVARTFRHAETLPNGQSAIGTPVNLRVVFRIEEERQRFASR